MGFVFQRLKTKTNDPTICVHGMYRFTQDIILEISTIGISNPDLMWFWDHQPFRGEGFNPPPNHLPDASVSTVPRSIVPPPRAGPPCHGYHGTSVGEHLRSHDTKPMLGKEFSQAVFRGKK